MEEFAARLAELAALWNTAERRAKAAEQFRGEAIIAAINEMRYAGRRIVDAWALMSAADGGASKANEIHDHLTIAKSYLINADHDITDSVCFMVVKRVNATIEQHGKLRIQTEYAEFENLYPVVIAATRIVQGSREDRVKRTAEYQKLAEEYQPQLEALYHHLLESRSLALHDPATGQLREIWNKLATVTTIVVVGAIAGVAALLLEIFDIFFLRGGGPP